MEERTLLLLNLAESFMKSSKAEKAEYIILHSMDIESTYEQYMELGKLYSIYMNRVEDAVDAYKKALQFNENSTEANALAGEMLFRLGRKHEANAYLLKAVQGESNPLQYRAYYFLAVLYQNWNRPERSVRYLNLCLKLNAEYAPAVKMLNYLKNKYLPTTADSSF